MREIKFRGWNIDDLFVEMKGPFCLGSSLSMQAFDVIEQFTGLHDKDGKTENYHNDLIKDVRSNIIFQVVWNVVYAGWWCVSLDKTIEQPLHEINQYCINIGNIHEPSEREDSPNG